MSSCRVHLHPRCPVLICRWSWHSAFQLPVAVQSLSRVWLCNPMDCSMPGSSVLHCHLQIAQRFMSIELVMLSNHLILCHPFLLLSSIFPNIRGFSNESALHIRWPKYWSFSFSISPSQEYSGVIPLRIDWFNLLALRGSQESSPSYQCLSECLFFFFDEASILWGSTPGAFFSLAHHLRAHPTSLHKVGTQQILDWPTDRGPAS